MYGLWRVAEKELENVRKVFEYGFGSNFTIELEERFSELYGVDYAVAVNSGTSALHCALVAVGVTVGDEVITTPLTFSASSMCASYVGATAVFADVDPKTFNICPRSIEKKITRRTKAIVVVSLYGQPAELEEIYRISKKHNIPVVEDNAQCVLGYYRNRLAGSFCDIAIYSFQRSKHVTSGDGGMLITNSEQFAEKARRFSCLGYSTLRAGSGAHAANKEEIQHPSFSRHLSVGLNYRMPEIIAAILCAQLDRVEDFVKLRRDIAAEYAEAVKGCSWVQPQMCPEHIRSASFCFAFAIGKEQTTWDEFRQTFIGLGGAPFFGAWKLAYMEPAYERHSREGRCPVAEDLQPRLVQLKTNFQTREIGKEQAVILKKTLDYWSDQRAS